MTLRETAAFWMLELIGAERLPEVAAAVLAQGLDCLALRELAGESTPGAYEAGRLLNRVLDELSITVPDRNAARLIVARYYAKQIVDGSLTPYEGARRIWWGPANDALQEKEPEQVSSWLKLRHFIGFASEYEDDPHNRAAYEADILQSARDLVEDPEAA